MDKHIINCPAVPKKGLYPLLFPYTLNRHKQCEHTDTVAHIFICTKCLAKNHTEKINHWDREYSQNNPCSYKIPLFSENIRCQRRKKAGSKASPPFKPFTYRTWKSRSDYMNQRMTFFPDMIATAAICIIIRTWIIISRDTQNRNQTGYINSCQE